MTNLTRNPGEGGFQTRSVVAALQLTRPRNCALTAISVWVGALCSGGPHTTQQVALAAVGAAAIAAAGNGMNDVLDLREDSLNRPERPLPSGHLGAGAALMLSSALGVVGLTLAFAAGIVPGFMGLGVLSGLAAYNWWLKRTGVAGNLLVSLIAAATFPYGAAAAGAWGRWWIPALFAALYHGGRELVKGAEDTRGDRLAGVRTVALVLGEQVARRAAAVLLALVALAAPLPAWLGIYGLAYLAMIVLLDVFLASCVYRLWNGQDGGDSRMSRRLLVGMMMGLIAIVLGELIDRIQEAT